jgi:hypothetical protein
MTTLHHMVNLSALISGRQGARPAGGSASPTAARLAELVADLVGAARVTALEKLGEGERAAGVANRWLRTQLPPSEGDGSPAAP